MTIVFDLNTNASSTKRPLWESTPLDIVVTIASQGRTPARTQEATIQPHMYIHPPASDAADDEDITWSDAEWQ